MELTEAKKAFDDLCSRQSIDDETQQDAWALLARFYQSLPVPRPANPPPLLKVQEPSRLWPACAVYLVSSKAVPTRAAGLPLSHLLRDAEAT